MSKENNNQSVGPILFTLVQVALVVLKLCNVLTCSWFIVFLPIIILIGVPALILLTVITFALVSGMKIKNN